MPKKEPLYPHVTKSREPKSEEWPKSTIPEPYQNKIRAELRKIPTWKLQQAYEALGVEKPIGIEILEQGRTHVLNAIAEVLYERGISVREKVT